jgi:hypothetical protein
VLQLKVGYFSANIQPLANRQYEDENFEPNIAKDTHKPIDENAIRVFISYSKHNESAQKPKSDLSKFS